MTDDTSTRMRSALVLLVLLAAGGVGAWLLLRAPGEVETVDPALERARVLDLAERLAEAAAAGTFRVVLTGDDLGHLLREGTRDSPFALSSVEVSVEDDAGAAARLDASGRLARSGLPVRTTLLVHHDAPELALEATRTQLAGVGLPGVARRALDEQLDGSVDFGRVLADEGVLVEHVEIERGALVLAGRATRPEHVAEQLRAAFGAGAGGRAPPPERVGPGRLAQRHAEGDPALLVLGDSLAAGTGTPDHRDTFTARLHAALERRTGQDLGYANLAHPGATADEVVTGGQFERARAELATRRAEAVVVSVGANELLALLDGGPCASDLRSGRCADAIEEATDALSRGLDELLAELSAAGADEVVVLAPYNPFSVGIGGRAEARTDEAVAALASATRRAAQSHGATVADPSAAFAARAGSLTLLGASPPDIHPTPRGHDVLAGTVLDALDE